MKQKKNTTCAARLLAALVLVLFIPGMLLTQTSKDDQDFVKRYSQANKQFQKCTLLFRKADYPAAEKKLLKCLDLMPQHIGAHFMLSQLYYQTQRPAPALKHINLAKSHFTTVIPRLISFQKAAGHKVRQKNRELRDAIDSYSTLLNVDGSCGLFSNINNLDEQIQDFDEGGSQAKLTPPAEYYYVHGNIFFRMKYYQKAMEQYIQAVNIDPRHGNAYNNLANLLYMAREYPNALVFLKKAEENGVLVNPRFKEALLARQPKSRLASDIASSESTVFAKSFKVLVGDPPDLFYMNAYIIYDSKSRDAVLIDPGAEDPKIESFVQSNNLKIHQILNTHGHHDHIGANRHYARKYNVPIAAHESEKPLYTGENIPDRYFKDRDTLQFGALSLTVLHTPGHSPGSVCFHTGQLLVSGDTLFRQGIGKTWGKTQDEISTKMKQEIAMIQSKLLVLPENTLVLPGHGPTTTIGNEKNANNFLKTASLKKKEQ